MLRVAAVIGHDFALPVLTSVLFSIGITTGTIEADDVAVADVLEDAEDAGVVDSLPGSPRRYRFVDVLAHGALYETFIPSERARLHEQVGRTLEGLPAADEHLGELIYHFLEAGGESNNAKAAVYARRAGDRALAFGAYESAARFYKTALLALARRTLSVPDDAESDQMFGLAVTDRRRSPNRGVTDVSTGWCPRPSAEPNKRRVVLFERYGLRSAIADDQVVSRDHRTEIGSFCREGGYWRVAFDGTTVRIKDTKGVRCIAHLLRHPSQPFLALDLVAEVSGGTRSAGNHGLATFDAGVELTYRERLRDLRDELAEAQRFNDLGRSTKAQFEMTCVAKQLSAAVGLNGSDRKAGAALERARLMVTKRIKGALKTIDPIHPSLAHHLRASVRTGYYCSYTTPRAQRVIWKT